MHDALTPQAFVGGAARLQHSAVLRATGPDAASFLHGQLTNDFTHLSPSQARLAAFCSPKGRMLASFVGFQRGPDEIWLACRADLLPAVLPRLRMFVLRAKVVLEAADAVLLGLAGSRAAAWLADLATEATPTGVWSKREVGGASVVRLPDGAGQQRWLWAGSAADADVLLQQLPPLELAAWEAMEVHSGVAPVVAATADAFVPQMLNYELVGGVDFQKGCYPGQEIVARSQYRGTLKRRTVLAHCDAEMQPGHEVFWSGDPGQPSGLVAIGAAAATGGFDALVAVKRAALDSGTLHLGSATGAPLTPLPLPYALPSDTDAA